MRRSYTFGGVNYSTQKAAVAAIRDVLHNAPYGRIEGPDAVLIADLFALHPEAEEKAGCGIAWFEIGTDAFAGRGFWVRRLDGSLMDFSYRVCLRPETVDVRSAKQAARFEVDADIQAFKDAQPPRCSLSGQMLPAHELEVHHMHPDTFNAIWANWLAAQAAEPVVDSIGTKLWFRDRALAESWRRYHKEHADLRLLSKTNHRLMERNDVFS